MGYNCNTCLSEISDATLKCEKCLIQCCSSMCLQQHQKTSNCSNPLRGTEETSHLEPQQRTTQNTQPNTQRTNENKIDDGIPLEAQYQRHNLLRDSEEVKNLLSNPHLCNLLLTIDKAENADLIMQKAMLEPIFTEFADACLKVIEPHSDVE